MGLSLVTGPSTYPVTADEAKLHCRIDGTDENTLVDDLIAAATDYVEQYTGRAIVSQTWKVTQDAFSDAIMLPKGNIQSVTHVKYYDTAGDLQTVSSDDYTLDDANDPAWVVINSDKSWPDTMTGVNVVQVTYVAGYATVPTSVKRAILLLINQWYENRSAATEVNMSAMPNAVEALLANYRSYASS